MIKLVTVVADNFRRSDREQHQARYDNCHHRGQSQAEVIGVVLTAHGPRKSVTYRPIASVPGSLNEDMSDERGVEGLFSSVGLDTQIQDMTRSGCTLVVWSAIDKIALARAAGTLRIRLTLPKGCL